MVLFDALNDLMVLWIVLALGAIGGISYLIYRFVPGIRPEKKDLDEKEIAKEELDRVLQPMEDENVEIVPEVDDEKPASKVDEKKEK